MARQPFPIISVKGDPSQRAVQYGAQAKALIERNLAAYQRNFRHYAKVTWEEVLSSVDKYIPAIEAYDKEILEEIRGIAAGAGRAMEEILALNVRTEIMLTTKLCSGCTAVAALPEATASGHTLIGQNWDWSVAVQDSCVILEVEQDGKPNFVTFVEAGLLAKVGLNSAGLGLCVNAMVSDGDRGDPKTPFHVIIRKLLNAERLGDAIAMVLNTERASSANYLLAHREGEAIDLEAAPQGVGYKSPERGVLAHANHFVANRFIANDVGRTFLPDSLIRDSRANRLLQRQVGKIEIETFQELLRDHVNYPNSICRHPDPRAVEEERLQSVASLIMDLDEGRMYLSDGVPCENEYRVLTFSSLQP